MKKILAFSLLSIVLWTGCQRSTQTKSPQAELEQEPTLENIQIDRSF